jgi:hypothetical protein
MVVTLVALSGLLLASFSSANAQYHKMDNSQFLSVSAWPDYVTASWSRMLTNRTYISLSETYFKTSESQFSTDNFLTELAFMRSWVRLGNLYLNGGGGGFLLYTTSETIQNRNINDFSFGFDLKGEIEYLPLWWLGLTGEVRQLFIIESDFFNTKVVYGFGLRFYF